MAFLIWYLVVLAIGMGFMPLTSRLFSRFRDGGWIFSKSIGIFLSGYVMWVLSCMHVLKFSELNCILVLVFCIILNILYVCFQKKRKHVWIGRLDVRLILIEEILFLLVFGFWTYVVCFDPAAYGTEKFMDYGFMTTMMRADYMPPADTWYSGEEINYYYGGQYLATYLTKVTGVGVGNGYNLMRAMIAPFAFVMPFSIVYQLLYTLQTRVRERVWQRWCMFGGIVSGFAVSFCGNMHYVIYRLGKLLVSKITGTELEQYYYYYPDSTRYIGHDPLIETDKTIHEFPSYSLVVGDLHAHMVNLMFVLVVVGIALSWALRCEDKKNTPYSRKTGMGKILKKALLQPDIFFIGFFTGIFRWTNFWDFPIYFVVGGCVVFFMNLCIYRKSFKQYAVTTILQAAEVLAVGWVVSLPFTLTFDKIASNIRLTHSHSAFYQLLILWGLPFAVCIGFVVFCVRSYCGKTIRRINSNDATGYIEKQIYEEKTVHQTYDNDLTVPGDWGENTEVEKRKKRRGIVGFFCHLQVPDLFVFLMSLCAMGLIIMPEIIYVEDIYTTSYRANTMFKMTYQGYILFGICMAYIFMRALMLAGKRVKVPAVIGLSCLALTGLYGVNAIHSKYGNIFDLSHFKGLDASIFVEESFPRDEGAINWLNENVEGQLVVLEANGDSYTGYQRVSVATGLPTVAGWYVHEWLWRNDTGAQNIRVADIETIYTSTDKEGVMALIEKYDITYIYIGTLEREKFPDVNDLLLQEIGTVAYSNGIDTYIMKVGE